MDKTDEKVLKELGAKFKLARERGSLTQVEVANRTDITDTYYAMIERGEVNLTFIKLRKLLRLFKMKASEIPI